MTYLPSTFPSELGIASRVGLTHGVGRPGPGSFAEAEMRYREDQLLRDLARRRREQRARSARPGRSGFGVMSRWTTWLPSVPLLHRSSHAQPSSSACGS